MRLSLTLIFALMLWSACRQQGPPPKTSFYVWKTSADLSEPADSALIERICGAEPLYVRLFDVDFSDGHREPIPVGDLNELDGICHRSIVPVVYLTNRTFTNLSDSTISRLAVRVATRMGSHVKEIAKNVVYDLLRADTERDDAWYQRADSLETDWIRRIPEIQIDCDWTANTQKQYFQFLKAFRTHIEGRQLSCTIRLHQYRDRRSAGTPPVDRGMLMCYNTNDPKAPGTRNAILDLATVKGYLKGSRYPLPLDVALPLFSWGAWYREGVFRGLMRGWNAGSLADTALFMPLSANRFVVAHDTVIGKDYLRGGDQIRLDTPAPDDVLAVAVLLRPVLAKGGRLLFFDFQPAITLQHEALIHDCMARF